MTNKFAWDDDDALKIDGLSKAELATATGFTLNEITDFCRDGMPGVAGKSRGASWKFNLPAAVQWIVKRNADPLDMAKRESMQAVARKRRVEADKLESKLVEMKMVKDLIADHIAKLQSDFLQIPARLPVEVQDAARAEITAAINRFASGIAL